MCDRQLAGFLSELEEIQKLAVAGAAVRYLTGAARGAARLTRGKGTAAERLLGRSAGQHGIIGGSKRIYQRGAAAAKVPEGSWEGGRRFLGGARALAQSTPGRMAVVGTGVLGAGAVGHRVLNG